jgi:ribosomal protein S18 acetylase RimI-like enzyme
MIRQALESELPVLYLIYIRSLSASKQPCGAAWNRGHFQTELEQGQVWVNEHSAGAINSFVFCRNNGQAWELTQLATDPAHWKQGHMVKLLKHVIATLAPPFWLEVHELNSPACRLYEKLGFKEVGRRTRYYLDGGSAVLYSKT